MRAEQFGGPTEQARFRAGWLMASYAKAKGVPENQRCRRCYAWTGSAIDKSARCFRLECGTHRHATCNRFTFAETNQPPQPTETAA